LNPPQVGRLNLLKNSHGEGAGGLVRRVDMLKKKLFFFTSFYLYKSQLIFQFSVPYIEGKKFN